MIDARDVVKSFGPTPALRGASLTVSEGEIVAVMGPSGSGKSTLLHCLAGILVPESGEVWFGSQRVDTMRETERSAATVEVSQSVSSAGKVLRQKTQLNFGGAGLPLSELSNVAAMMRGTGTPNPGHSDREWRTGWH